MNWSDAKHLIRQDLLRLQLAIHNGQVPAGARLWSLLLMPEAACLALYRVGHFALGRGWIRCATLLYRVNITLTGADIHPEAKIGPSCLVIHPVGIVLYGQIGARLSVFARVIVAADTLHARLQDAPVIGDDVVLGAMTSVIGPVTIADRVHVSLCSLVNFSVLTPGAMVRSVPSETRVVPPKAPTDSSPVSD